MELNERLRELRKEQGETQKQVAAAIGIGERPYQYLESGRNSARACKVAVRGLALDGACVFARTGQRARRGAVQA